MTEQTGWLRAIDEALVVHHIGIADPTDDYETAKRKLNVLLCVAQQIGEDFGKQALNLPEQEPVAYMSKHTNGRVYFSQTFGGIYRDTAVSIKPLYAAREPRKPLSLYEIHHCADEAGLLVTRRLRCFARAVERAHGIGEQHE